MIDILSGPKGRQVSFDYCNRTFELSAAGALRTVCGGLSASFSEERSSGPEDRPKDVDHHVGFALGRCHSTRGGATTHTTGEYIRSAHDDRLGSGSGLQSDRTLRKDAVHRRFRGDHGLCLPDRFISTH